MGATLARVQSVGSSPVSNDCSKMKRNTGASSIARPWSNLPGIPSGPEALLTFMPSSNFVTPSSVICKLLIGGKGVPGSFGGSSREGGVNTDLNWSFKISHLDKLSVYKLPLLLSAEIPKDSCFWAFTYFQNGLVFQDSSPALKSPPNITVYFELFLNFSAISVNSVSKSRMGSVPLSGGR